LRQKPMRPWPAVRLEQHAVPWAFGALVPCDPHPCHSWPRCFAAATPQANATEHGCGGRRPSAMKERCSEEDGGLVGDDRTVSPGTEGTSSNGARSSGSCSQRTTADRHQGGEAALTDVATATECDDDGVRATLGGGRKGRGGTRQPSARRRWRTRPASLIPVVSAAVLVARATTVVPVPFGWYGHWKHRYRVLVCRPADARARCHRPVGDETGSAAPPVGIGRPGACTTHPSAVLEIRAVVQHFWTGTSSCPDSWARCHCRYHECHRRVPSADRRRLLMRRCRSRPTRESRPPWWSLPGRRRSR